MSHKNPTDTDWAAFEQVRRLRVHDDIRGGYPDAVIGQYDRRGYARCLNCPGDSDSDPWAISSGNSAAVGEACDICGALIHQVALAADPKQLQPITCMPSGQRA